MQDWYIINNVSELDTPALVVYPNRVKHNIGLLKTMIDDVIRLRPHVKTHKSPDVIKMMLQAGITKFKCATIAEAEMLGMCNAPDVLLAYQPVGPKLQRFLKLIETYPDTAYSCLIDNAETAKAITYEATLRNTTVAVYIDLNVGMNRTGIIPANAFELYQAAYALTGLRVLGLHAYDGHIHDADINTRQRRCEEALALGIHVADEIKDSGLPKPVIIAGGSPTFPIVAQHKNFECSPGTFVYWDKGYQLACEEQPFLPAALIVARIISLPDATKLCVDVGHKSVSAENELRKRIYFLNAPELTFVSQSEEHIVAEAAEGHEYKVGDILYGLPYHVCPTVALYERAYTIEEHEVTGEWKNTARDRKITV